VQTTFSFDSGKQAQVPAMITGKPMTDFKIGRMTLRTVSGKGGRDKLLVRNATFILPGLTFPENGVVTLTVGELTMRMPSVEQEPQNWKKRNGVYTYTNRAFYRGTVKATFDMNRNEWRLQLDRAALGGASFADHPVVRLSIGEFEAGSALETRSKMSLKSPF
jgi:hypothetical protein